MGAQRIRVLAAAYAAVPGSSPHGAAMTSMIEGLRADLDLVTLKTENLPHVKRIADARMFRVPVAKAEDAEKRNLYMRAVARQLDAEPYHVVHVMDPWAGKVAATHPRRRSSAVLLYELATFPDPGVEDEWLDAHRITMQAASRVLTSTQAMAEAIGSAAKVDVIAPGVDTGGFDFREVGPFGKPRVLYLGSFGESRDLSTLLDAIEKIRDIRPLRAMLAGETDAARREDMRGEVRRRDLQDVVDVRGEPKPHQLPGIVAAADVCVVPARDHQVGGLTPLPQPLLEHMACYRPVVVADVPGVTEIVRDEVEGLLYPAGSATALADAVLEVLRDAVMRERIAAAAYRKVRDELGAGARRRRVRQVYELVVPGSQVHDPWDEGFEELTGMIELSDSQIELLDEGKTLIPPTGPDEPSPDTTETQKPAEVPAEPTRPRARLARTSDTHPGLVVPDTDPGRN